jgi:hypothetical protein
MRSYAWLRPARINVFQVSLNDTSKIWKVCKKRKLLSTMTNNYNTSIFSNFCPNASIILNSSSNVHFELQIALLENPDLASKILDETLWLDNRPRYSIVYENRRKNPKYSAELAWINLDLKENRIESLIRLQLPLRKMHKNIRKKLTWEWQNAGHGWQIWINTAHSHFGICDVILDAIYMHLRAFELNTRSSKTDRRSSHKYNEDRHSKKSWQCINWLPYLKDSRDPDIRDHLFPWFIINKKTNMAYDLMQHRVQRRAFLRPIQKMFSGK